MKKVFISLGLCALLIACDGNKNDKTISSKTVNTETFSKETNESDVQIIDVRTPEEFAQGHIENAININIMDNNFETEISKLDKSKKTLVYCKSGGRSSDAAQKLSSMGFENISNLEGGLLAWQNAGLKVIQGNEQSNDSFTKESFLKTVKEKHHLVLVDFNAEWCGPCKKLSPIVDALQKKYPNDFYLLKVDVDKHNALAQELKIESIPLLYLYKDGELVWQELGLVDEAIIEVKLKENFK
ncbi:MAG: hypothetical protein RLZZ175_270 [Bacteroidota bacterium]|jgi:thioredoxin 1